MKKLSGSSFMRIRMKLSIILTLVLVAVLLVPASPVEAAEEPSGYWTDPENITEPTDYDPASKTYTIYTASELAWIADLINNDYGTNWDYTFVLGADIDLSGYFWVPIGTFTSPNPFMGTFDGDGHTISNMTIGTASLPSTLEEVGLFGYANGAIIKNVNITNVSIYANLDEGILSAGGLVGMGHGCEISEVTVAGGICASSTEVYSAVGGIVGNSTSNLNNCTSAVNIIAEGIAMYSGLSAGGLVGSSSKGNISSCYSVGTVSGAVARYAGGLIGYAVGNGTVTDSYATGDVDVIGAVDSYAGGLIGDSNFDVENCFALGDVTGQTAGGLIGLGRAGTVKNSFAVGNVTASGPVGGLVGMSLYNGLTSISNCYASGNIETTETSVFNQYAGGLVGIFNPDAGTLITNSYWNSDATQTVNFVTRDAVSKVGIDRTSDVSTAKTRDEMCDVAFAALLNENNEGSRAWSSIYGINGGYPYLEGLYYDTPTVTAKVSFISDGVDYLIINVPHGDEIEPPFGPIREHYIFSGWYTTNELDEEFDFSIPIMSDISIYAKWEEIPTYTIAYDLNGGEGITPSGGEYVEGDTVKLADGFGFERDGYVYGGWTTSSDGGGTLYYPGDIYTVGNEDITFYVKWDKIHTYTYNLNGGEGSLPSGGESAESYIMLAYQGNIHRDGYVFKGWTTSSDGSGIVYAPGSTYNINGDVIFYAKWDPLPTYTVTYNLNEGTGYIPEEEYYEGDSIEFPSDEGLERDGYFFGGWMDKYGVIYYPGDYYLVTEDVTFYARWTNNWIDMVDMIEDQPYYDEDTNTVIINNSMELAWVAYMVNIERIPFSGIKFEIVNDIDLSGHDWVSIGYGDKYFSGIFDGNNKTISNLTIGSNDSPNDELSDVGLFGYISEANISNVNLLDVEIYSAYNYAYVGSLVGYAHKSNITNCQSSGIIQGGERALMGGLVGFICDESTMFDNFTLGDVKGGNEAIVGGLIGYTDGCNVYNNYAAGNVEGGTASVVGGFAGSSYILSDIRYGYWNSDAEQKVESVSVEPKKGIGIDWDELEVLVTPKTSEEMRSKEFFELLDANKSDDSKVWTIVTGINNGYPIFTKVSVPCTVIFDKNGGDTEANPVSMKVDSGKTVGTLPTASTRSGYTFICWNTEANGSGTAFTASTIVNSDITVYAQWKRNTEDSENKGTVPPSYDNQEEKPKSTISTSGNNVTSTTKVYASIDSRGKASVRVTQEQISDAVAKAVEVQKMDSTVKARVEIKVNASNNASAEEIIIPKKSITQVSDAGIDSLMISTPIATITFDTNTISTLSEEATEDIKISVSKVDVSSLSPEAQQLVGDKPVFNFRVTSGDKVISQFGGDVSVSVPYIPKDDEDTDAIIIYYINEAGELEVVKNCIYDSVTGRISFSTRHFSQYAVGYNKVSFRDVAESDWYSKAVGFIAAREITTGTGGNNFNPEAKLTRGQFIVMLMRAYDIAPDLSQEDNFADAGMTYYTGYLGVAKSLGISAGVGNNLFAPNREITRQEMFTLLYNTLKGIKSLPKGKAGKPLSAFTDAENIASWAKEAMTYLIETGVINGRGNKLLPTSTTTRAEMAQVLYNLLSR